MKHIRRLFFPRSLLLIALITVFGVGATGSPTVQAQSEPTITLSAPNFWQDLLTPEVLAEFENQFGVRVHVEYTGGGFFGGSGTTTDIESRFETTTELVSSADVIFVDSSDVTVEDTQAGFFLNLAPLANNDATLDIADFVPSIWQSYQWDQGIWVLPLSTDVIIMTYDWEAFDAAGIAYPTVNWTIDDFANAARQLTVYNADGTVAVPGLAIGTGADASMLLQSLLGYRFYDATAVPSLPQFSDPTLENILQTWQTLLDEGVVGTGGFGNADPSPISIEGRFGYSQGFNNQDDTIRHATLLPNSVAPLNVQGFAVSSGTQYPELAYELAKFLTGRSELASNPFSVAPARYSIADNITNTNGQGGRGGFGGGNVPADIQPIVDEGLTVGLPVSEMRYANYINSALTEMSNNGGDAQLALQTIEAQAIANQQTAIDYSSTVTILIATPPPVIELAAGQVELNIGVDSGFGGGGQGGGGQLPNQEEWDQINSDFLATNAVVGIVNLESTNEDDPATLAEQFDCFILPENLVAGNDVSTLLNLDPLLSTDPNFNINDIIGDALIQLQQDNRTYGIPIVIQPQMLEFDVELFNLAGVPIPVDGWTIDEFAEALRQLSNVVDPEIAPFTANDPSGAYMSMLIAAYGGLPIDYRTNPPTINFTDPATVDAIQQALDLAVNGYLDYPGLSIGGPGTLSFSFDETYPISTDFIQGFRGGSGFGPGGGQNGNNANAASTTALVLYPQGNQYGVISYNLYAGYVSATAENPEACYSWLSSVAQNPQLFDGMPALRSLINDPDVIAAQGEDTLAVYSQVDTVMQNPNTIVFPVNFGGGGGGGANFLSEYWLRQAYDSYVLEGADLEIELMEAESVTQAYLDCAATLPPPDPSATGGPGGGFAGLQECAQRADPAFALGN